MQATYDDATLLLRLYELRRDEKMREARAWFMATFKPKSVAELQELCPPGSVNNAFMRQVVTYWDMAASFVNGGVLNPDLFFDNNRECLVVWLRVRKLLANIRCKVNLIALNPGPGIPFETPDPERVESFQDIVKVGMPCFIRKPRGLDIYAACGQLKRMSEGAELVSIAD